MLGVGEGVEELSSPVSPLARVAMAVLVADMPGVLTEFPPLELAVGEPVGEAIGVPDEIVVGVAPGVPEDALVGVPIGVSLEAVVGVV